VLGAVREEARVGRVKKDEKLEEMESTLTSSQENRNEGNDKRNLIRI
jgi:hypothetical protein